MKDVPKIINVFVSYARKDEVLAKQLVKYFEENEINCFIDKRDIPPGSKYAEEIIHGIERSDVVVLILTKHSNASDNVRNEIDNASNFRKKIIVFRVENIALSKGLQLYLSTSQWFDAFLYRGEQYFEQLANHVKGLPIPPFSTRVIKTKKIIHGSLLTYTVLSIVLFISLGIPILRDYSVVNKTNPRGIRLVDAIKLSGFTDIEARKWEGKYNMTPPIELYMKAKREIFVSGITLRTTIEIHREYLRDALERGVKIRLLLLSPNSPDSFVVRNINKRMQSYANSIGGVLSIIQNDTAMFKNKNVEVRFADNVPPLIGLLIDGDIAATDDPNDSGGVIRINPYFKSLKHNDWYLQFSASDSKDDAFSDFAAEYRHYWKNATKY